MTIFYTPTFEIADQINRCCTILAVCAAVPLSAGNRIAEHIRAQAYRVEPLSWPVLGYPSSQDGPIDLRIVSLALQPGPCLGTDLQQLLDAKTVTLDSQDLQVLGQTHLKPKDLQLDIGIL
ncbi:hypothetical protein ACFL6U_05315 [Planctomycetota bacterium]